MHIPTVLFTIPFVDNANVFFYEKDIDALIVIMNRELEEFVS